MPPPTPTATTTPTPSPLPSPTPSLSSTLYNISDTIGWLRDAGLTVEVLEEEKETPPRESSWGVGIQVSERVARVSVDAYRNVWIHAMFPPMSAEEVFTGFSLHADFTREGYPTIFKVDNVIVEVRGYGAPILGDVYVALWDRVPTFEVLVNDAFPHIISWEEVIPTAQKWLTEAERKGESFVPAEPELRLARLGDYTARFPLDVTSYSSLPHPDSWVWLVQFRNAQSGTQGPAYGVVVTDLWTDRVVGATYRDAPLPADDLPSLPGLGPLKAIGVDGRQGLYYERAAIVAWDIIPQVDRGALLPDTFVSGDDFTARLKATPQATASELPETFVLERAESMEGPWGRIAVLRPVHNGYSWSVDGDPGQPLLLEEGRAIVSGARLWYWDRKAEVGRSYFYRVYGCTESGARTSYTNVATSVAGDPFPDMPHAYLPSTRPAPEPQC